MRLIRSSLVLLLLLPAVIVRGASSETTIEPGLYADRASPGWGVMVDIQKEIVALGIYSWSAEGDPRFFVASGQLRHDAYTMGPTIELSGEGLVPVSWVTADLFEVVDGPCLECAWGNPVPPVFAKGRVSMWFPRVQKPFIHVQLFEEETAIGERYGYLERLPFGRFSFARAENGLTRFVDLMGTWVFVRTDVVDEPAIRANFSRRVPAEPAQPDVGEDVVVSYFDDAQDIEFRCGNPSSTGPSLPACTLFVGGSVRFTANFSDIGINKIRAYPGTMSNFVVRRPGEIIGLRVN
jgi:hypothetical protein